QNFHNAPVLVFANRPRFDHADPIPNMTGVLFVVCLQFGHPAEDLAIHGMDHRPLDTTTTVLFILLLMTRPTHSRRFAVDSAITKPPSRSSTTVPCAPPRAGSSSLEQCSALFS